MNLAKENEELRRELNLLIKELSFLVIKSIEQDKELAKLEETIKELQCNSVNNILH